MNPKLVEQIAKTILYEGYLLYPYRPSALKNQQRFNFGVLYPQDYGSVCKEPFCQQTECLIVGDGGTALQVQVRFLQLQACEKETGSIRQEAIEQEVKTPQFQLRNLLLARQEVKFHFPGLEAVDVRRKSLAGVVEIVAVRVREQLFKITVRTSNLTPIPVTKRSRDAVMLHSLVSAHTVLTVGSGEFVSLLDPPEALGEAAASCQNIGTWPVLVGEEGERQMMLSSPIIFYDYPQVAPESAGDFFDGTEIDEMLTLRLLTLTDEEKRELSEGDDRARRILERTENLPAEQLSKLHAAMRGLKPAESEA